MTTQGDNALVRVQAIKTYDDGDQQTLQMHGRYNETLGGQSSKQGVPKIQAYGYSYHAPEGSQGSTLTLDGNPDKAMCVGMEHKEYRPRNLQSGEWILYSKFNAQGHSASLRAGGQGFQPADFIKETADVMTIQHAKKIVLKVGSSEIEITGDSINIVAQNIYLVGTCDIGACGKNQVVDTHPVVEPGRARVNVRLPEC